MNIDRSEEYLKFALQFNKQEEALRDLFAKWLPDDIVDCHVHVGHPQQINEFVYQVYDRPFCSFLGFDLQKSRGIKDLFYSGKRISMLRFAWPFQGINHRGLNEYLLKECPPTDKVVLCGIPTDIDYTVSLLSHERIAGLKMHRFFFVPPAREIYQFFPKTVLETAQSKTLPIILHLPEIASNCISQVEQLICDFPNLRIVLAHLGGYTESLENLERAYKFFARHENLYVDTAMVFSSQAIRIALNYFGEERILYGSDEPLNLLRIKMYQHPVFGSRLISEYPYHWISPAEYKGYKHLAHNAVHAHWQTLLAIKEAIGGLPKVRRETTKKKIFFENSKKIFSFA